MEALKLYGPSFSSFLRSMRLICQYKGLAHEATLAPFGELIRPFSDEHAALHPFKKMPVLLDGDLILQESSAIARYLDDKVGGGKAAPPLYPADPTLNAQVSAQASMLSLYVIKPLMSNLVLEFFLPKGENGKVRIDVVKAALPEAERLLLWLDNRIGDKPFYIAEQFTLCDALLIPMLDYMNQLAEPYNQLPKFPPLQRYLAFQQQQYYSEGLLGKPDLSFLQP
ncbi:MAG TPA: glutathione S-transferase family protein [Marinagarivorans sp.]